MNQTRNYLTQSGGGIYDIVIPKELNGTTKDGIVNKKKFYALKNIGKTYKYCIIVDSETLFIKEVDLYSLCEEFFNKKILLGNKTNTNISKILKTCKKYFKNYPKNSDFDSDLYLWFNQPCIYDMDTINDFFEKIDYEKNIYRFEYFDFEYYIYMFYLILFHNFKVQDIGITATCAVCEEISPKFLKFVNNDYKKFEFLMCHPKLYDILKNEKLFLLIHLDRKIIKFRKIRKIISFFIPSKKLRHIIRNGG